jgi:hypothetical protein
MHTQPVVQVYVEKRKAALRAKKVELATASHRRSKEAAQKTLEEAHKQKAKIQREQEALALAVASRRKYGDKGMQGLVVSASASAAATAKKDMKSAHRAKKKAQNDVHEATKKIDAGEKSVANKMARRDEQVQAAKKAQSVATQQVEMRMQSLTRAVSIMKKRAHKVAKEDIHEHSPKKNTPSGFGNSDGRFSGMKGLDTNVARKMQGKDLLYDKHINEAKANEANKHLIEEDAAKLTKIEDEVIAALQAESSAPLRANTDADFVHNRMEMISFYSLHNTTMSDNAHMQGMLEKFYPDLTVLMKWMKAKYSDAPSLLVLTVPPSVVKGAAAFASLGKTRNAKGSGALAASRKISNLDDLKDDAAAALKQAKAKGGLKNFLVAAHKHEKAKLSEEKHEKAKVSAQNLSVNNKRFAAIAAEVRPSKNKKPNLANAVIAANSKKRTLPVEEHVEVVKVGKFGIVTGPDSTGRVKVKMDGTGEIKSYKTSELKPVTLEGKVAATATAAMAATTAAATAATTAASMVGKAVLAVEVEQAMQAVKVEQARQEEEKQAAQAAKEEAEQARQEEEKQAAQAAKEEAEQARQEEEKQAAQAAKEEAEQARQEEEKQAAQAAKEEAEQARQEEEKQAAQAAKEQQAALVDEVEEARQAAKEEQAVLVEEAERASQAVEEEEGQTMQAAEEQARQEAKEVARQEAEGYLLRQAEEAKLATEVKATQDELRKLVQEKESLTKIRDQMDQTKDETVHSAAASEEVHLAKEEGRDERQVSREKANGVFSHHVEVLMAFYEEHNPSQANVEHASGVIDFYTVNQVVAMCMGRYGVAPILLGRAGVAAAKRKNRAEEQARRKAEEQAKRGAKKKAHEMAKQKAKEERMMAQAKREAKVISLKARRQAAHSLKEGSTTTRASLVTSEPSSSIQGLFSETQEQINQALDHEGDEVQKGKEKMARDAPLVDLFAHNVLVLTKYYREYNIEQANEKHATDVLRYFPIKEVVIMCVERYGVAPELLNHLPTKRGKQRQGMGQLPDGCERQPTGQRVPQQTPSPASRPGVALARKQAALTAELAHLASSSDDKTSSLEPTRVLPKATKAHATQILSQMPKTAWDRTPPLTPQRTFAVEEPLEEAPSPQQLSSPQGSPHSCLERYKCAPRLLGARTEPVDPIVEQFARCQKNVCASARNAEKRSIPEVAMELQQQQQQQQATEEQAEGAPITASTSNTSLLPVKNEPRKSKLDSRIAAAMLKYRSSATTPI